MLSLKDIKFLEKNKKARDTQGLFVTEGRKLFAETPAEDIVQVVMTKKFAEDHPDFPGRIPQSADVIDGLDEARFFSLSDTKTPQGILTVTRRRNCTAEEVLSHACPLVILLENLQDPGNAGTILRTAEAAGAAAVVLTEGSVDLYSPKTVRATMGAIFRVPHLYVKNGPDFLNYLKTKDVRSYGAHLGGRAVYTDVDCRAGTAFVIGNESRGITEETAAACSALIRIPMMGKVESLNAAMAAGILMYEALRQRRQL